MDLRLAAMAHPDKAAVISPDGSATTYAELDRRSRRLARHLYDEGLRPGDHLAVLLENRAEMLEVAWAAQRSGLYYTPVNCHLTADEASYVVEDCGASALIASTALIDLVRLPASVRVRIAVGGPAPGYDEFEHVLADARDEDVPDPREGAYMFYSSGTTGRPKGILPTLSGAPFGTGVRLDHMLAALYGFGADTVYLCTGPLYHAAPLGWSMGTQRHGGTVVLMGRFDPAESLALVERYAVTHAQYVPTMFVRMLRLPEEVRTDFDLSSLRRVVHAAAPCPVAVKEAMISWLGPILDEYYSGSEGVCFVAIDSPTWLAHPGSVGRPVLGEVHVLDDDGLEVPPGEIGQLWFSGTADFSYHHDPAKTAAAHNARGWTTIGDLGRVDADGFVYLSDRRVDLIITGGVNVYPQEVEDVLAQHPAVRDVVVVGLSDPEMGQRVVAVAAVDPDAVHPDLARELVGWAREHLAHFKAPREVHLGEVPRLLTGKLLRREVRARLEAGTATRSPMEGGQPDVRERHLS